MFRYANYFCLSVVSVFWSQQDSLNGREFTSWGWQGAERIPTKGHFVADKRSGPSSPTGSLNIWNVFGKIPSNPIVSENDSAERWQDSIVRVSRAQLKQEWGCLGLMIPVKIIMVVTSDWLVHQRQIATFSVETIPSHIPLTPDGFTDEMTTKSDISSKSRQIYRKRNSERVSSLATNQVNPTDLRQNAYIHPQLTPLTFRVPMLSKCCEGALELYPTDLPVSGKRHPDGKLCSWFYSSCGLLQKPLHDTIEKRRSRPIVVELLTSRASSELRICICSGLTVVRHGKLYPEALDGPA